MGDYDYRYANRGKNLENQIELSNKSYMMKNIATVQKVATPTKVIRRGKKIVSAFFEKKSTLDFIGVIDPGIAIAFDVKETKEKYFPLKNIQEHQMGFMDRWKEYGGLPFLVVYFQANDTAYRIEYEYIKFYWNQWQKNKGKRGYAHIPLREFEQNGTLLKSRDGILLDYLEGLY